MENTQFLFGLQKYSKEKNKSTTYMNSHYAVRFEGPNSVSNPHQLYARVQNVSCCKTFRCQVEEPINGAGIKYTLEVNQVYSIWPVLLGFL